jgi:hypothetical protein
MYNGYKSPSELIFLPVCPVCPLSYINERYLLKSVPDNLYARKLLGKENI